MEKFCLVLAGVAVFYVTFLHEPTARPPVWQVVQRCQPWPNLPGWSNCTRSEGIATSGTYRIVRQSTDPRYLCQAPNNRQCLRQNTLREIIDVRGYACDYPFNDAAPWMLTDTNKICYYDNRRKHAWCCMEDSWIQDQLNVNPNVIFNKD